MNTLRRVFLILAIFFLLGAPLALADGGSYFVVSYDPEQRAQAQSYLQDTLVIEGYLPEDSYIVKATADQLATTDYIIHYESYYTFMGDRLLTPTEAATYLIQLFPDADKELVITSLTDAGIPLIDVKETYLFVSKKPSLEILQSVEGIEYVSAEQTFSAFNNQATTVTEVPAVRHNYGLFGQGQIVAVADTGLDTGVIGPSMHDDIEGRVVQVSKVGVRGTNPADENGHGTHVTGTVLGNGILSGSNPLVKIFLGSYAGVAPEAQVIAQDLGDDTGGLGIWPPFPLSITYSLAYQQGARVHSNSWGSLGSYWWGNYETWAQDTDNFIHQNKDLLVVYAAGNYGSSGTGTVIPPSTAKNVISVGALGSNPNTIASFSSRGYTLDGRVKPDLVAPGTSVISTRSSVGISCPVFSGNPNYCILSGTSMATPHVVGIGALVQEYYRTKKNHATPSAALVKATLINGAEQVGSYPIPSQEAGWGRVNIDNALPLKPTGMVFYDEQQGLSTGAERWYPVSVKTKQPLTATLVWTDKKGLQSIQASKALVNDLDLEIVDAAGASHAASDGINNVEQVRISKPNPGSYTLKIKGANIPIGTQDYALVVSYDAAETDTASITGKSICKTPGGNPC